jgi:hypothetical protein
MVTVQALNACLRELPLARNVASLRLRHHGPSTSANGACGTFGNATRAATSTKRPFISARKRPRRCSERAAPA